MWRGVVLFPPDSRIRFVGRRRAFLVFSALLIAAALVLLATRGLNFGIDFEGGILIEVRTLQAADVGAMRSALSDLGLGEVTLQEFGAPTDVLIRVARQAGGEGAQQQAIDAVRGALPEVQVRRTEFVGPQVSAELLRAGIYAVLGALGGILVYIWFRFEWQFGLAALVALLHDVISTLGMFALLGFEFNLTTVAAVLTIAGYSINDTVVVFDRVRENLRKFKTMPMHDLFDRSINQTLSRTVMTSLTTLVAVFALYVLGGEVIKDFSFALAWGIAIGTYSSICVALPVLLMFDIGRGGEPAGPEPEAERP